MILFLALVAILFNGAEQFEQFWWRVTHRIFLYNYFKIPLLVKAENLFKDFLFLALAAILSTEQSSLSNSGRGLPKEHSSKIILKSVHRFSRKII